MTKDCSKYLEYSDLSASVEFKDKIFSFSREDIEKLNQPMNYWHHADSPSSWVCTAITDLGKKKFKNILPLEKINELCARTLRISDKKLAESLEWDKNYMAWHDNPDSGR